MELDRLDVFRSIYDSFITSTISFSATKESFIIKFTVRRYYIYYYDLRLRVKSRKESCIRLTQKNSIEFLV